MNDFLRLVILILGIFLIAIGMASFLDVRAGSVPISTQSFAYFFSPNQISGQPTSMTAGQYSATATVLASQINTMVPTTTPMIVPPTGAVIVTPGAQTATVAAAFTQIAVSTQTVIPTSTELPNTGIDGGGPGGTGFTILGNHTVRANEYLYCLGRAYGVTPEAIARVNFLSLNATLFVGQTLVIPDAPWEDIPAGRVCTPQFESPYAPIRSFSETSFADPLHISFHGKYPDLEQSHPVGVLYRKFSAITPEPADEIRTVKVTLPTSMRLGESSLITLELNVETGQPTVSVTSSPNVSPDVSTNTPPDQKIDLSKLKIPALFDKYRIFAVARMDAAAFNYSPQGDIKQEVSQGKNLVWHWSIKPQEPAPQSLIISIRLTFEPKPGQDPRPDEDIWSNWYQVDVTEHVFESVFGKQASIFTSFTFITGGILSLFSVWDKIKPFKKQKAKEQSSV